MAFKAILFVNGKQYPIKNYHYSGTQPTDATNKPMARPQQGYIDITVEASNDEFLYHWFSEPEVVHNGKVVFYNSDISAAMRTLSFENAYCVNYDEDFNDSGAIPMTIDISITAGTIDINGIKDKKAWG